MKRVLVPAGFLTTAFAVLVLIAGCSEIIKHEEAEETAHALRELEGK